MDQRRLLPQDRKYPVVYADPPWRFALYNEESGVERAAGNHYPTLALEDICALPVADLITQGAVLFLWTTASHLQESFQVLAKTAPAAGRRSPSSIRSGTSWLDARGRRVAPQRTPANS
jgi:hypothetical protein